MNISHRHRYLYFVTPKCGSASVRHALEPYTDVGYPVSAFAEHVTIAKYLEKYADQAPFGEYFKFTFVRNPYDRIYSAFRQDVVASRTWEQWIKVKAPIFDEIGESFDVYLSEYVAKANLKSDWRWINFCPTVEFSCRNGDLAVDWYGRMESLQQDLGTLSEKLGITIGQAGRWNDRGAQLGLPLQEGRYLGFYTRKTVQLVNQIYENDFKVFGYEILDPASFPEQLEA